MNLVLFVWLLVVVVLLLASFPSLRAGERSEPARSDGKENFISMCPGAGMHLLGRSHAQCRVRPMMVIQMDSAMSRLPGLQLTFKICIQPIFLFQNPVDAFRQGILGAVILFGHAYLQTRGLDSLDVRVGGILAPAIRMMNGPLGSLETSQGHAQGFQTVRGFQRFA